MPIALTLLLATVAQQPAPTEDPPPALVVMPRVSVYFADLQGRVEADQGTFPLPSLDGTSVHFDSDLDVDDDPAWVLEVVASHGRDGRFVEFASLSWLEASYEGSSTLDSTERFNGYVFPAGSSVRSKVRVRSIGADLSFLDSASPFLPHTYGAMVIGARYTDLQITMEGSGGETDERLRLLWLGVGFRVETNFTPRFSALIQSSIYLSLGGWADSGHGVEDWAGYHFEVMVAARGSVGPLQLEAGWRKIRSGVNMQSSVDETTEDNEFVTELDGPYVSATLRF